jgi:hypothetical protein
MANRFAGEVEISLGDGTHMLQWTWNAGASFQTAVGKPLEHYQNRLAKLAGLDDGQAILRTMEILGPNELRALLWSMLLEERPTITIAEVGKLMQGAQGVGQQAQYWYIYGRCMDAWTAVLAPEHKKKFEEMREKKARENPSSGEKLNGTTSSSSQPSTESQASASGT